jgi:two-component system sensor histidine kinase KdpD
VQQADSVVLVDLPVDDLQERMRQGKIYPPAQAARALDNFFRSDLLGRLRELALLQTASYSGDRAGAGDSEARAEVRLAVALPFDPAAARPLILRASRLAGRMNSRWFAVYVRRASEHPGRISAAEHRQFLENVELPISLGATVVTRESQDVVSTLIDFVRAERITLLVLARTRRSRIRRLFSSSVIERLLERGRGFDVVVADV